MVAAKADRDVQIGAAQDVWALGVMAYEAIVGAVTFSSIIDVGDCAVGVTQYPWDQPTEAQPVAWRRSRLRTLVAPCLARDPATRPTATALLKVVSATPPRRKDRHCTCCGLCACSLSRLYARRCVRVPCLGHLPRAQVSGRAVGHQVCVRRMKGGARKHGQLPP